MSNPKKLIVFVDRGGILRSPIAAYYVNELLESNRMSDKYVVISRRTQGVTPDDPIPPLHDNYFQYTPSGEKVVATIHNSNGIDVWHRFYWSRKHLAEINDSVTSLLVNYATDLTDHISMPIDFDTMHSATSIFAMDRMTCSRLERLYPEKRHKINLFTSIVHQDEDIQDPEKADGTDQIYTLFMIYKITSDGFATMIQMTDELYAKYVETRAPTPEMNKSVGPERL